MSSYYTYILTDPRTNQPFYVGKGTGDRMFYHERAAANNYCDANKPHHNRIREILEQGHNVVYDKVLIGVTEGQALDKERELIKTIGRVNKGTGPLLNIDAGGSRGGREGRRVSQYTLEGKHIRDFENIKEASECVSSANRSYITQVCKGRRKSAGGFLWAYKGNPVSKFEKEYYSPVLQYSLDGKKLATFRSLTEAQKATGIELHNISECCRGKSKTAGGFYWKYAKK